MDWADDDRPAMMGDKPTSRRSSCAGCPLWSRCWSWCCSGAAPSAPRSPSRRSGSPTGSPTGPACSTPPGARGCAQAIDRLRAEGTDLFVVYVDSFDGADGQTGPATPPSAPSSAANDVLLAVAVADRAYGVLVRRRLPAVRVDHRRHPDPTTSSRGWRADDWAGAAVALADGLPAADAAAGTVAPGSAPRRRRRRGGGRRRRLPAHPARRAAAGDQRTTPVPTPPPRRRRDEFSDVATEELGYRASSALIEVDDAVRTSEQELSAARGHFGDEAVAEFTAALEQSRADMVAAFEIRQRLDDETPEDEPTKRAMYARDHPDLPGRRRPAGRPGRGVRPAA